MAWTPPARADTGTLDAPAGPADDVEAPGPAPEPSGGAATGPWRNDPVLWLTVIGAAVLRFWRIGRQSLWYDEYVTTLNVKVRLVDLYGELRWREGTPPLYYFGQWAWVRIFGQGDLSFRTPSAIVGTLTVLVVYALLLELGQSRRAARVAAALAATNPMLVWYSQEARAYSLLAFLLAVTLLLLARALNRQRPVDHLAWSLVAAAAFATHYYAAFLLVPQGLWLLSTFWKERRWREGLLAFGPLVAVSVPLAILASTQRSPNQDWIADFSLPMRLNEAGRHYTMGPGSPIARLWILTLVPIAYAAFALVRHGDRQERRVSAAMLALGLAGFALGVGAASSFFVGRNAIGVLIALAVPLAVGLAVKRARLGPVLAIGLCTVWVFISVSVTTEPKLQKPDWKGLATALDQRLDGEDTVFIVGNQGYQALPIQRYGLADADIVWPGETVRMQELDLLYHVPDRTPCGRWSGRVCEMVIFPRFPEKFRSRLTFLGRVHVGNFQVVRYRAETPIEVEPEELVPNPRKSLIYHFDR